MTPSKRCTAAGQALWRLFSSYLLTSPSSLSVDCWRSNQHVDVKKNNKPQRRPTLHPPTMTQTAATATATSRSATCSSTDFGLYEMVCSRAARRLDGRVYTHS